MITCLDTGRTIGETAAEQVTIVYGSTGAAAKEILSRDAGFEWVPSLAFLHERHFRDRALLVYPPAPTSAELGVAEALDANGPPVSRAEAIEIVDLESAGGYGVFAVEPISIGALVVEYAGLVAPATDDGFDPYGLSYAETLAGEPLRLSARRFGNAARFVNHTSIKPNAEIVRVVHRGLLRVVIVAREGIAPGGQVLVDYGDAYWRASGVAPRPLPRILADVGTDRYRF